MGLPIGIQKFFVFMRDLWNALPWSVTAVMLLCITISLVVALLHLFH